MNVGTKLSRRLPFESGWASALFLFLVLAEFGPYVLLGPASYIAPGDNMNLTFPQLLSSGFDGLFQNWYPFQLSGVDRWSQSVKAGYLLVFLNIFPPWLGYQLLVIGHAGAAFLALRHICLKWLRLSPAISWWCALLYAIFVAGSGQIVSMSRVWFVVAAVMHVEITKGRSRSIRLLSAIAFGLLVATLSSPLNIVSFDWAAFPLLLLIGGGGFSFFTVAEAGLFLLFFVIGMTKEISLMIFNGLQAQRPFFFTGWETVADSVFSLGGFGLLLLCSLIGCLFWRRVDEAQRKVCFLVLLGSATIFLFWILHRSLAPVLPSVILRVSFSRALEPLFVAGIAGAGIAVQLLIKRFPNHRHLISTAVFLVLILSMTRGLHYDRASNWVMYGNGTQLKIEQIEPLMKEQAGRLGQFRVESVNYAFGSGFFNVFGLETASGYLNLYPARYEQLFQLVSTPRHPDNLRRGDQEIQTGRNDIGIDCSELENGFIVVSKCFDLNLLGLLNVKYLIGRNPFSDPNLSYVAGPEVPFNLLTTQQKIRQMLRENFGGEKHIFVYRLNHFAPRSFLAKTTSIVGDWNELKAVLKTRSWHELSDSPLFIESDLPPDIAQRLAPLGGGGETHIERFDADLVEIRSVARRETMLIVTNSYNPLWSATVDGKPTAILPAYGAFWGVVVPQGEARVRFTYSTARALPWSYAGTAPNDRQSLR